MLCIAVHSDFLKTCYWNNIFTYQAEDKKLSKILVPIDGSELSMEATGIQTEKDRLAEAVTREIVQILNVERQM